MHFPSHGVLEFAGILYCFVEWDFSLGTWVWNFRGEGETASLDGFSWWAIESCVPILNSEEAWVIIRAFCDNINKSIWFSFV